VALPLNEVLERRFGVDEDDFAAALVAFADRAGPLAVVDIAPTEYFGGPQQATLRKLGASLRPLETHELGPIAGLAAAHAELVTRSSTVAEIAKRLGVDSSRVRQRIYARSLYAFKHRGAWLIPSFQIRGRNLVPGLDRVLPEIPTDLHPVAVSRWFTSPHADLVLGGESVSPLTWLRSGGPAEPVAALAAAVDQL
jgi:hypothetical protein